MTPIRTFFNAFPQPYKAQAFENARNAAVLDLGRTVKTAHEALQKAFIWAYTPEGAAYWHDFALLPENSTPYYKN